MAEDPRQWWRGREKDEEVYVTLRLRNYSSAIVKRASENLTRSADPMAKCSRLRAKDKEKVTLSE